MVLLIFPSIFLLPSSIFHFLFPLLRVFAVFLLFSSTPAAGVSWSHRRSTGVRLPLKWPILPRPPIKRWGDRTTRGRLHTTAASDAGRYDANRKTEQTSEQANETGKGTPRKWAQRVCDDGKRADGQTGAIFGTSPDQVCMIRGWRRFFGGWRALLYVHVVSCRSGLVFASVFVPVLVLVLTLVLTLLLFRLLTIAIMGKLADKMGSKAADLKQAISSRQAMVKYLEAPLLEGDRESKVNRRVRLLLLL